MSDVTETETLARLMLDVRPSIKAAVLSSFPRDGLGLCYFEAQDDPAGNAAIRLTSDVRAAATRLDDVFDGLATNLAKLATVREDLISAPGYADTWEIRKAETLLTDRFVRVLCGPVTLLRAWSTLALMASNLNGVDTRHGPWTHVRSILVARPGELLSHRDDGTSRDPDHPRVQGPSISSLNAMGADVPTAFDDPFVLARAAYGYSDVRVANGTTVLVGRDCTLEVPLSSLGKERMDGLVALSEHVPSVDLGRHVDAMLTSRDAPWLGDLPLRCASYVERDGSRVTAFRMLPTVGEHRRDMEVFMRDFEERSRRASSSADLAKFKAFNTDFVKANVASPETP